MRRYAVVIEDAGSNMAGYVPDLPGCVATGASVEEVERLIREVIALHIEGVIEDGLPIPEPTSRVEYVEVNPGRALVRSDSLFDNRGEHMDGGWRPEATLAVVCVGLLPVWVWITGLNMQSFWLIVLSLILGVGIGSGLSGVRRGGRRSRVVAGLCVIVLLVVGIVFTASVRLDPWLQ